jgi:glycosyltransferase involved in cell wall biosynthesis
LNYSIVVPTLNEEKLLPQLLSQISDPRLKNNYNYEIIISDGGSVDSTREISLELADKIVVHTKKERQNISQGRNAGAELAEGDWIIFLNGDVLISDIDKFFDKIQKYSSTNSFSGITFSVLINPDEENLTDRIFLSFYNYYFHLLNIIGIGMSRGECMVVNRQLFEELKGFNEKLAAGEDFDLFTRVRKNGKVKFLHNPVIYESPRRYRKEGHFKIMFKWLINSLAVYFKKKSVSKEWKAVR